MALEFQELQTKTPAMEFLFLLEIAEARIDPLYVSGGTFPYSVIESFSHLNKNSVKYFPGPSDVDGPTVEIFEMSDNPAWNWFNEWHQKIYFADSQGVKDGSYNLPNEFKRDIEIFRLGPVSTQQGIGFSSGVEYPNVQSHRNLFRGLPGINNIIQMISNPSQEVRPGQDSLPGSLANESAPPRAGRHEFTEGVLGKVFGLRYTGCWPKTISEYTPTAEGQANLKFTVTFSADDVEIVLI